MNYKYLLSSLVIVACCLQPCCWAQSTTVRPYKFGFNIDQQQHRREMRDERGIVMGEFGFITADGIYHVTVYATDEQGRFRILAMKSYPYESPPKTVEVMVQPKIPPTTATTTTPKPLARHNFNTEACSGCFLTNGNNKPKVPNAIEENTSTKTDTRLLSKPLPNSSQAAGALDSKNSQKTPVAAAAGGKTQSSSSSSSPAAKTANTNQPPIMDIIMQKVLPALMGKTGQTAANRPAQATTTTTTTNNNNNYKPNAVPSGQKPGSSSSGLPTTKSTGATGPSAVNGDGDLYRFKYILDYHGHTETGKRNGNKEGSYFAIGDDNVERTIQYVANEFGYQPRIRWRRLDSNEIKSNENTLKDYEFVWFSQ